jgi:aspartate racemase
MAKKIGIIGGMSPESTIEYYRYITRTYTARFGDYGYPEILIDSVSFQPYVDWPKTDRWDLIAEGLSDTAKRLELAGADFLIIATNTMHLVIDDVRKNVQIPMISIMDVVGEAIHKENLKKVGLLGTRFTMEKTFYQDTLKRMGIDVITPELDDRIYINDVIYDELVGGLIRPESQKGYHKIIRKLVDRGAEGIVLGCTEIPLLVNPESVCQFMGRSIPLFDTTILHAEAALQYAIR